MSRIKRGIALVSDAKEIANNIRAFCEDETQHHNWINEYKGTCHHVDIPLGKAYDRANAMCRVGKSTLTRLKKESEKNKLLKENGQKPRRRGVPKAIINKSLYKNRAVVMDFNKCLIRRIVYEVYAVSNIKEAPSAQLILERVKSEIHFPWGRDILVRLMKEIGFDCRRSSVRPKMRFMLEKSSIVEQRNYYLRSIRHCRDQGFDIVYIGAVLLFSEKEKEKDPTIKQDLRQKRPEIFSKKFVILHAGSTTGFLPNTLATFEVPNLVTRTVELSHEVYEKWVNEQLVPNLPSKSIVVQDTNVPTRCIYEEHVPKPHASKLELQEWLKNNNIPYVQDMLKAELLSLVKMNKRQTEYKTDNCLKYSGFSTLHLPKYHTDLNPVDLVWFQIKATLDLKQLPDLSNEQSHRLFVNSVTATTMDQWNQCYNSVLETEKDYGMKAREMERRIEEFLINLEDHGESSGAELSGIEASDEET